MVHSPLALITSFGTSQRPRLPGTQSTNYEYFSNNADSVTWPDIWMRHSGKDAVVFTTSRTSSHFNNSSLCLDSIFEYQSNWNNRKDSKITLFLTSFIAQPTTTRFYYTMFPYIYNFRF